MDNNSNLALLAVVGAGVTVAHALLVASVLLAMGVLVFRRHFRGNYVAWAVVVGLWNAALATYGWVAEKGAGPVFTLALANFFFIGMYVVKSRNEERGQRK